MIPRLIEVTVTREEHATDPAKYSRMVSAGAIVTLLGRDGRPVMEMSNGPRMHECRACGEVSLLDDEAAEDEHDW